MWMVEQRQGEVFKRLDRIDERLEVIRQKQDENRYRIEGLEKAARSESTKASWLDPTVIRVLVAVMAAAFLGLAGGRIASLLGLQ